MGEGGCIAHQWRALALQYLRSLSGSTSCPFLRHWPHTNFIWRSKVLDVGARGEAWGREPQPQANRAKLHPPNCCRDAGGSLHTHMPATSQIKSETAQLSSARVRGWPLETPDRSKATTCFSMISWALTSGQKHSQPGSFKH